MKKSEFVMVTPHHVMKPKSFQTLKDCWYFVDSEFFCSFYKKIKGAADTNDLKVMCKCQGLTYLTNLTFRLNS